jgi:hypothetical protein
MILQDVVIIKTKLVLATSIAYARWLDKHPPLQNVFVSKIKVPNINFGMPIPHK